MWSRVEEQRSALQDPREFLRCDGLFHREIALISANPIFPALSEAMFGWLSEFHVSLVRVPGCEALTLAEHSGIAEAIENGAEDLARQRMTDHLDRANELYRRNHRRGEPRNN